jgi:hypothetical protein
MKKMGVETELGGLVLVFIWDPKILSRSAEDVMLRGPLNEAAAIDRKI